MRANSSTGTGERKRRGLLQRLFDRLDGRNTAYCLAQARRKFDELVKANASAVAAQAIQRIAWLYRIEADAKKLTPEHRLQMRHE